MTLTSHPTNVGTNKVRVLIAADTICDPHGHVSAGDVVDVTFDEFHALRVNNKAEIYVGDAELPAEGEDVALDAFVMELAGMTKVQLVKMGKDEFGLDLVESSKKDELIEAITKAAEAKAGKTE